MEMASDGCLREDRAQERLDPSSPRHGAGKDSLEFPQWVALEVDRSGPQCDQQRRRHRIARDNSRGAGQSLIGEVWLCALGRARALMSIVSPLVCRPSVQANFPTGTGEARQRRQADNTGRPRAFTNQETYANGIS